MQFNCVAIFWKFAVQMKMNERDLLWLKSSISLNTKNLDINSMFKYKDLKGISIYKKLMASQANILRYCKYF